VSGVARALTIAGSDSGGGAGIQADLKTFHQLGAYGMSAITAVTAQNTLGVQRAFALPPDVVEAQLDSVLSDIGADAAKTGMLATRDIVETVARKCREYGVRRLVVDPVLLSSSGTPLLAPDAVGAFVRELLPLAALVTPNAPEACALLGLERVDSVADMEEAARRLHALGPKAVLVKGGHVRGADATDVLFDGETFHRFVSPRQSTPHTHGTGCTLSAAATALLARGAALPEAIAEAKRFIDAAIRGALPLGRGVGPTHHGAYPQAAFFG